MPAPDERVADGEHEWDEGKALAYMLSASGLGYWRIDLETGRLWMSDGSRHHFGIDPADDVHTVDDIRALVHPDDVDDWQRAFDHAGREAGVLAIEHRIVTRSGSVRWVMVRGRACRCTGGRPMMAGMAIDLTERREMEAERERLIAELADERARLRALIEHMPAAVVMSEPSGHVVLANRRADTVFPQPAPALPARLETFFERWEARHADGRPVADGDRALPRALRGEQVDQEDYRYRQADGAERWVRLSSAPIRDEGGAIRGGVLIASNVDREKRAEEFERALIGIVSHDLKNPLNTILLSAGMLARSDGHEDRVQKNAFRIRTAAERATRMIRDLLDFTRARLGAGIPIERRWVDLAPKAGSLVDEVRIGHPDRSIRFDTSGDCSGAFDVDRLAQVLTNLVENAVKYSPDRSAVRVTLRGERDAVVLCVHNDGPPIPPELLPKIFEPLQRGDAVFDPTGRSVGLGLYIVKHLVEAHGGHVSVHSSEGEGTDFTVGLPRASQA